MKRHAIALLLFLLFFLSIADAQEITNTAMNKYLAPAQITKLDWILLRIQVESLAQVSKWDDFGLITSVTVYSTKNPSPIGMTFTVDNKQYLRLDNSILSKIFTDVVASIHKIVKHSLPESNLHTDVYANFVLVGGTGKIVAEIKFGKISFFDH